jgi:hypothetical protein
MTCVQDTLAEPMHGRCGGTSGGEATLSISKTSIGAKEATAPAGTDDKPTANSCFDDWRRFCFALRAIANGTNNLPMSPGEAQRLAKAVLTECGYAWQWHAKVDEQRGAAVAIPESARPLGPLKSQTPGATLKLKAVGKIKSLPDPRRANRSSNEQRLGTMRGNGRV